MIKTKGALRRHLESGERLTLQRKFDGPGFVWCVPVTNETVRPAAVKWALEIGLARETRPDIAGEPSELELNPDWTPPPRKRGRARAESVA